MDLNDLRSFFTVLTVFLFGGIVWWAFSGRHKQAFEEAAQQPLLDDDQPILSDNAAIAHPDK